MGKSQYISMLSEESIDKLHVLNKILLALEQPQNDIGIDGLILKKKQVDRKEIDIKDDNFLMDINEYDTNIIKKAKQKGFKAIGVKIDLNKNTLLKSARAFVIFKNLEEYGEIIKSYPAAEDIEYENFDFSMELLVITTLEPLDIEKIVDNISEVDKVFVEEIGGYFGDESEKKVENKRIDEVIPFINTLNDNEKRNNNQLKKSTQLVSVDSKRLDSIMDMASQLIMYKMRLEKISNDYKLQELNETLEQLEKTTLDLKDLVTEIGIFPKRKYSVL
ncbi:hypothetical protein CPJCM30710_07950 [Clostridium polyendosporum]|uniref:histidine kinase n=1 Tax=Clostridium polyendosporum TaxID=69208 RepID=A0A919RYK0_9CLOT|nr:hypothetical protein [Clostridium polyendosporum]GIM28129.1 hypothetical protein CPJCM30710_07950 [Clostridium polyendosporum]